MIDHHKSSAIIEPPTAEMTAAAVRLVEAVRDFGLHVDCAYWLHESWMDRWYFHMVGDNPRFGLRETMERLDRALQAGDYPFSMLDVTIWDWRRERWERVERTHADERPQIVEVQVWQ